MDYMQQRQWRNPHDQQDQPPSAKIPKLLHDENQSSETAPAVTAAAAGLSLSVEEPNSSKNSSRLLAFPDPTLTRYPTGRGLFSLAQRQELELQALIFKHMLTGASVPLDLVLLLRRSMLNTPAAYYHHRHNILPYYPQHYLHYQQSMLQAEYWGRTMDSEPGRCRRTDGKKWRCSRDVMSGQKYCEHHIHRGRNRSRKPVEIPTPLNAPSSGIKTNISASSTEAAKEAHFTLSGSLPPANDLVHLNQRSSNVGKAEHGPQLQIHEQNVSGEESHGEGQSDGHVLRQFFDDWPRSQQEPGTASCNSSPATSSTHLSISMPGNPSSDFSLKLATGDNELGVPGGNARDHRTIWASWGAHHDAAMGGPLAEALRSQSSTAASPTSVLHKAYGSLSEASSICT